MPARKIDFAELRKRLSFATVLAHYQAEGKEKGGEQWQGYCPLPAHAHKGEGGKARSPSFSVNLARGIYNCFGCGSRGNVLEFVVRMEGFDPEQGDELRQGAARAEDLFLGGTPREAAQVSPSKLPAKPSPPKEAPKAEAPAGVNVQVNVPLDFTLQGLDPEHPYLYSRGLTAATIAHFGLGFAARGLMKNRIAIPIKNQGGQLVGYAGRLIDDDLVDEDTPKYRFPGDRVRDGQTFAFRKSELLYYPDELRGCRSKYLFVVEGFPSVWWLWQHGIRPVVAVMGASMSERQAELVFALTTNDARIVLVPDGDDAGRRLAHEAAGLIAAHRFVRWLQLPDGKQPTDWSAEDIAALPKRALV